MAKTPDQQADAHEVLRETVDICICTYRRPQLAETLRSLAKLRIPNDIDARIIVVDNDETPSAREVVMAEANASALPITYFHAPKQNISIARNACIDQVQADWMAWIDDDETADESWLAELFETAKTHGLDAVFGPAMAIYPDSAPTYFREGDFHSNRPKVRNGEVQTGHTCNALLKCATDATRALRFDLTKGKTGGEDTDYFYRMWLAGAKMGICGTALVYERVDPKRLEQSWLSRRSYNSGVSYGDFVRQNSSLIGRLKVAVLASIKVLYCAGRAAISFPYHKHRLAWGMRARMHMGVFAGIFRYRALIRY